MKKLLLFLGFCLWSGLLAYHSFHLGRFEERQQTQFKEQHDLCYDTKTHEAYLARKGTELLCFMRQRGWPHRTKSSVIE